jgi:hypothetical protein
MAHPLIEEYIQSFADRYGSVQEETVLEEVSNSDSSNVLYRKFAKNGWWDDSKVAHEFRVQKIRQIIHTCTVNLPALPAEVGRDPVHITVNAYTSIDGEGYVPTVSLIDDSARQEQALTTLRIRASNLRTQIRDLCRVWGITSGPWLAVVEAIDALDESQRKAA